MIVSEEIENKKIAKQYKELLQISYQTLSNDDKKLIRSAFDTAVHAHREQRRKSGEPYIFHPIGVAKIVAKEIGLDATSIAAALLHDVVEDTEYCFDDIDKLFGSEVKKIVEGLTKISKLSKENNVSLQAENFRKLLVTLNDDIKFHYTLDKLMRFAFSQELYWLPALLVPFLYKLKLILSIFLF